MVWSRKPRSKVVSGGGRSDCEGIVVSQCGCRDSKCTNAPELISGAWDSWDPQVGRPERPRNGIGD